MGATRTCRKCGSEFSGVALEGLCPSCLGRLAFVSEPEAGTGAAAASRSSYADLAEEIPTVIAPVQLTEGPGTVIARYKLLEKIGEGGFGAVYVAEQREPLKRRVALKIIKLGMDTRQVIARFEAERQALALMDHPNIAKVFDAGATETGRPYFVMELVRGIPITQYCDENHLSADERLKLFMLVCQAIQHAHQKGDYPPRHQTVEYPPHRQRRRARAQSDRLRHCQGDAAAPAFDNSLYALLGRGADPIFDVAYSLGHITASGQLDVASRATFMNTKSVLSPHSEAARPGAPDWLWAWCSFEPLSRT